PSGLGAGAGAAAAGVRAMPGLLAGGGASARALTCPRASDSAATPHRIPIPLLTANPPGRPLQAPPSRNSSARATSPEATIAWDWRRLSIGQPIWDPEFGGMLAGKETARQGFFRRF